ncbi:MAG TPA: signal recognition particle-docking protein FtsY [Limnochordales bacterium]|nr:signal recognition particle-docking protein FtsY [Limnochordales bacterium]
MAQPGGWLARLRAGLARTRAGLAERVEGLLGGGRIDESVYEGLEEALIQADMGVATTMRIMDGLRERVRRESPRDAAAVKELLREEILAVLEPVAKPLTLAPAGLTAMLIVGVNGAGKTTSVGKLAYRFRQQGRRVVIGAADTFRAAAIEQLQAWGERAGATVIAHQPGADPAAVAFDAAQAAVARGADVLLVDTAGRLQTRTNLMEELKKVHRVLSQRLGPQLTEVLLVLDATTGQNGLSQARLFGQAVPLTGIILTKLDGTAKGGIVVAIAGELGLPVKLVGVGEGVDDLQDFDAAAFAQALFS